MSRLKKRLIVVAFATALPLAVPAIGMQFTSEVAWGPGDFLVAGMLLLGAGALVVLGLEHIIGSGRRVAWIAAVLLALALTWAELAVGLFS